MATLFHVCLFAVIGTIILNNQVFTQPTPPYILSVHVVFMNHLDVGYNGIKPQTGFINNVLNVYFNEYFPRAINLSQELRDMGYVERFIYTTHPWLVSLYVDCPQNFTLSNITLKCPTDKELANFKNAVAMGDITWHAGPMNMQIENMNELLLGLSLNISTDLDKMFNITRKHKVLSQRDVPGMTQAMIPTLVEKGIDAVSVGVNPGTSPPAVPNLFRWQFEEKEIIGLWHPGGYPLNPGTDPVHPGGLSINDCVFVQNCSHALCFAFRTDNSGPPETIQEILENYEILRRQFLAATIFASTFDNFIVEILPMKDQLPLVTQEIGDTWIQGIASDPYKLSYQRAFQKGLELCYSSNECNYSDPRISDAVRYLVKVPEHTWGLPSVHDNVNWTNIAFKKALTDTNYRNCVMAWDEQRQFLYIALDKLADHPLAEIVRFLLSENEPVEPNTGEYILLNTSKIARQEYICKQGVRIGFTNDGSIRVLYDPFNKVNWAAEQPIGTILYNTYNESDYDNMAGLYNYMINGAGYDKPNSTANAKPESKLWKSKLNTMWRLDQDSCNFVLELVMENSTANTTYGAPESIYITYKELPSDANSPAGFSVSIMLKNKTPTRLAESISYYFSPTASSTTTTRKWFVSKVGHLVDPTNVIHNGSQYVHAVDSGAYFIDPSGHGLQLITQDAPLVVIGTKTKQPSPFPVPLEPISEKDIDGVGFNIFNNIWNTNYIFWYPFDANDVSIRTRYMIQFKSR